MGTCLMRGTSRFIGAVSTETDARRTARDMAPDVRLLLITGTRGAGKTTLMAEASDVLIERGIVHAAIDLDTLGIGLVPPARTADADPRADGKPRTLEDLMYRNLAVVWQNYRN